MRVRDWLKSSMAHTWADPIKPCALIEVARSGECGAGELLGVQAVWRPLRVVAPLWQSGRSGRMGSCKMVAKAHYTLVLVTADQEGGFRSTLIFIWVLVYGVFPSHDVFYPCPSSLEAVYNV